MRLFPSMKNAFCASAVSSAVFHKVANSGGHYLRRAIVMLKACSEYSALCTRILMVRIFSIRNSTRSCDR